MFMLHKRYQQLYLVTFLLLLFVFLVKGDHTITSSSNSATTTTTATYAIDAPTLSWLPWLWMHTVDMIKTVGRLCCLPILPFWWMTRWLWQQLVVKPWYMAVHATYLLTPILLYCGAACMCGLIIGGVSGFAAESLSSAMISATWGKEVLASKEKEVEAIYKDNDDDDDNHTDNMEEVDDQENGYRYSDDDGDEGRVDPITDWQRKGRYSPASSLYRFSISSTPSSFYDDKPDDWQGDEDPEDIATFLRQRRKFQEQQQQQQQQQ